MAGTAEIRRERTQVRPDSDNAGWRKRFHAWWEGYELGPTASRPAKPKTAPAPGRTGPGEPTVKAWPDFRRRVVQQIFGEGMISPGGDEAVQRLIRPLNVNETMTVVELGAGLGGISRILARDFGIWVTGYEPNSELAGAANAISAQHGLGKKAAIRCMPLQQALQRINNADAFVAKEALLAEKDKRGLFEQIRRKLKPGGQIVLTEFLRIGNPDSPNLQAWMAHEPFEPHLISPDELRGELTDLGMDVRVMEDISREYRAWTLESFAAHAEAMKAEAADPDLNAWTLSEGELWARRVALLETDIAVYRCLARLPGVAQ